MSEKKYFLAANGQEVQKADLELLGTESAFADDRVVWELVRMLPGSATPQKLIIPYGVSGWASSSTKALVGPSGADGKVIIQPFRGLVGSTVLAATNPLEALHSIHSGYALGATTLSQTKTLAANSSGSTRWDLVYATVTPEVDGPGATRYKKDPTTLVVSSSSVATYTTCTVVINVVTGTPAAPPLYPALPADGGGAYNIPLAFVRVPNGFGAASTVARGDVFEVAPCALQSTATGVKNMQPADGQFSSTGAVESNQDGNNLALRPGAYLPATMVGSESRIIAIQRGFAPLSHIDGDVIDASIDWRNRLFRWTIQARSGSTSAAALVTDRNVTGTAFCGSAALSTQGTHFYAGGGQSFVDDNAATIAYGTSNGTACYVTSAQVSQLTASSLAIHVRNTDGALVLKLSGADTFQAYIWLEASGPYRAYAT